MSSNTRGGDNNHNRKRGMKPRSKRNRKRPRAEDTPIDYKSSVLPLQIHGEEPQEPKMYVRIIQPYPFTFSTFAKARWMGRSVLDVYCSEFGSYPSSYYESAIRQGKIKVSDEQVDVDYKIKGQDVLSHTVHRHEPGVLVESMDQLVAVVAETDELLIVDKKGTLPVHPCGAYQQNSLIPILEASKFGKLHVIHRLDRLTSGLVLLAKNSEVAQRWGKALMERETCEKVYLARVKGKFPCSAPPSFGRIDGDTVQYGIYKSKYPDANEKDLSASELKERNALGFWLTDKTGKIDNDTQKEAIFNDQQSVDEWFDPKCEKVARWFHLTCPTRIASHKNGVCEAGDFHDLAEDLYSKSVKSAQTSFGVVRYDEKTDSTIVLCRPKTGRTHQIRLHLQYLGHPIANDPCYGGDLWYGDVKGKSVCDKAAARLQELSKGTEKDESGQVATISDTPATEQEIAELAKLTRGNDEPIDDFIKRTCVWCARSGGDDETRNMLELLVRSRGIWLHALKYKMKDSNGHVLDYRTKPPNWSE